VSVHVHKAPLSAVLNTQYNGTTGHNTTIQKIRGGILTVTTQVRKHNRALRGSNTLDRGAVKRTKEQARAEHSTEKHTVRKQQQFLTHTHSALLTHLFASSLKQSGRPHARSVSANHVYSVLHVKLSTHGRTSCYTATHHSSYMQLYRHAQTTYIYHMSEKQNYIQNLRSPRHLHNPHCTFYLRAGAAV